MTTFYIAGPMTGIPQFNFPAFDAAADMLRSQGHNVVSPADLDRDAGFDPVEGKVDWSTPEPNFYAECARRDIGAILQVDAIAVLEGWEKSAGARVEVSVARWLGLPVVWASDLSPVPDDKAAPGRATTLPTDKHKRKTHPVASGVLDYFPDALVELAHVSYVGNEQHNAGEPLHWAREKSTDEADALIRHFLARGARDADGLRHTAKVAWRALAMLQKEIEAEVGAA